MAYPDITQLPDAPNRGSDTSTEFSNKTDDLLTALQPFVDDVNAAGEYIQDTATEVEGNAEAASDSANAALGAANYKGDWTSSTNVLQGQSYSYNDSTWIAKQDSLNKTPAENTYWLKGNGTAAQGILTTSDTDFTDGRVVRVGNGALFSQTGVDGQYVSDWDAFDANNYVDGEVVFQNPSTLNSPISVFCSVRVAKQASNRAFLVLYSGGSNIIYVRRYLNDTPLMDWQPIITGEDIGTDSDQIATNGEMGHIKRGGTLIDWSSVVFSDLIVNQRLFYNTGTLNMPAEITDVSSTGNLIVFKNANSKYGGFLLMSSNAAPAIIPVVNGVISTAILPYTSNENATSTEINTGTSTDTVVTPSGLAGSGYNPDNRYFESSNMTASVGGVMTAAHGLGETPKWAHLIAECTTAQFGFSVGDTIILPVTSNDLGNVAKAASIKVSSTTISVYLASTASLFWIQGPTNYGVLNYSGWTFRLAGGI